MQKGCGTLFFGVFGLAGLLVLGAVCYGLFGTLRTYLWEETPCTIVESRRIDPSTEKPASARDFLIRYRYRAQGREYTSSQFTKGIKESLSSAKIERLLYDYPKDSRARCYVDPKNPADAILRRGSLWFALILLFPMVFIAVGVGGVIGVWRKKPWGSGNSVSRRARAASSMKFAPVLIFGLFTLVGAVLGYFLAVRPLCTWYAARTWTEVPCTILSSSVGAHTSTEKGKTSTTYSVDVLYRYRVAGREYQSDRYEIFGGSSSGRSGKEEAVARYPAGSQAICYVDPKDPTSALLNRDLSWLFLLGLFPAVFFLVGAGGLLGLARSALRASQTATTPVLPGVPTLPANAPIAPSALTGGRVTLNPSASPVAKFIGAILVALFWNGITGVFVGFAVKSWLAHRPEWFLMVFLIPFVLIGLLLIGVIGWAFLNLFNPRLEITVNATSIPLGGTLELQWRIRGAASRIRKLAIRLEGREEARYRRGTSTSTDRSVFARLPVIETDNPQQIASGQAQLVIPARLMHSWDGGNNKIIWELQARGEIPRYPDVTEDFSVTILPQHT